MGKQEPSATSCPELAVLEARGWSPEVRAHVAECGSCRLVMELIEERSQAAESRDRRAECVRFEALIAVRVGGELTGAAQTMLDEHLRDCDDCRALADTIAPSNDAVADHPALPAIDAAAYVLGAEVARGGMGRIVAARDLRIGRPVAVKELLGRTASQAARFEREARVTARLQHPGIVPIYEIGRWENGTPFYAMRMVKGRTLRSAISARASLESRLALLPSVIAATEAVAFAHANQVIHRDLMPSNIMVGDYGETVVIDWGLAKDLAERDDNIDVGPYRRDPTAGADLTAAGAIVGTASYMPPEQAAGQRVDTRADVYALGALLYHLLAGHAPYRGNSEEVLSAVKQGPPLPLPPNAPRDLVSIVAKAMSRDPADRYPSARELAAELTTFQAGRLVAAHEYSRRELLRRWLRRHRAALAVATIALVVLAGVGVFSIRGVLGERDRAEAGELEAQTQRASAEAAAALLLEESGRQELLNGNSTAAAVWLSASYSAGNERPSLRLLLARAMRDVEALERTLACDGSVRSIELSSDETRLLVGCRNQVKLWNIADGTLVRTFEAPKAQDLHARYALDDTRVLAWGAGDNVAHVWDASTGTLQFELPGHTDRISNAVADRRNQRLLTASFDGTIRLWNMSGTLERTIVAAAPQQGLRAGFVADGASLASVSTDGVIQIWDSETGRKLRTIDNGAQIVGGDLGDRRTATAVVCGADGTARVWDLATGTLVRAFVSHAGITFACTLSHDGKRLLTTGSDGFAKIWDVATGRLLSTLFHGGVIHAGAFSADDVRVATSGSGVKVWQASTGALLGADETHGSEPGLLRFAGDRVVVGESNDVSIWNRLGGDWLRMFSPGGDGSVKATSRDGRRAIVQRGTAIEIWDVERAVRLEHAALQPPFAVAGDRLVARSSRGVEVVDLRTGKSERTFTAGSLGLDPGVEVELLLSRDGRRLIATARTTLSTEIRAIRSVAVDVSSGNELARWEGARVFDVDDDGTRVVLGHGSASELWEVSPPRRVRTFDLGVAVMRAASFDRTKTRVIIASGAPGIFLSNLAIWDVESGARLHEVPNILWFDLDETRNLLVSAWFEQIGIQRLSDGSSVARLPIIGLVSIVGASANAELLGAASGLTSKVDVIDVTGRILATIPVRPSMQLGQADFNVAPTLVELVGNELRAFAGHDLLRVRLDQEQRPAAAIADILKRRSRLRLDDGRIVLTQQPLAVLTGRITRKHQPVGDATIRVSGIASTTTAADGTYRIILGGWAVDVMASSPAAFARPRSIVLREGENHLDIELDLAASIAGVVVDGAGHPVDGVAVHADCTGCAQGDSGDDITRADGTFELRAMSGGGVYTLRMLRDGKEVLARAAPSVPVKDGEHHVTGIRIELAPSGSPP